MPGILYPIFSRMIFFILIKILFNYFHKELNDKKISIVSINGLALNG